MTASDEPQRVVLFRTCGSRADVRHERHPPERPPRLIVSQGVPRSVLRATVATAAR
jgi:hypothetical protein